MSPLPRSSLLESRSARLEWARQRFFEEGQVPTGIVSDTVFESWSRCLRVHGSPHERVTFQPVTASRTQLAMMKNRDLWQAWMDEVPHLESVLGATSCTAMLTDATGVLIGSACAGRAHESLMPVATRLGVNLSEEAVGTTAPGVVARTGKAVCVLGGEHFFDSMQDMHCAAAPIRDIHGHLAGVFDLSSERIPFAFDAAAVAGLFAAAIGNRLLVAQATEHLVIRFQVAPELLDSSMVGLVGIDVQGRLAWENGVAHSLLGGLMTAWEGPGQAPAPRFGLPWDKLAALPASGAAPLALPNGLHVWARAEMRACDGRRGLVGARDASGGASGGAMTSAGAVTAGNASAGPSVDLAGRGPMFTLRDADQGLIERTLSDVQGNVSEAARRLGVSRGLIYRRRRDSRPA